MSKLEELINQLCPDGVEYKTLNEIAIKISSGGTPLTSNQEYYNGNIPWLRTQEVDWDDITDTSVKISEEAVKNSSAKWISANCVIVAMYGATAAKVAVNKIPLTTNQACCNIEVDQNQALYRYVYYWLCNNYDKLKGMGQGSQSNINAGIIKTFLIPLPPLPVQEEIVRILDNMTSLTAELTAELTARQKQYEYYRDSLLSFDEGNVQDGVRWMKLQDIADIGTGSSNTNEELEEGLYPFFVRSQQVRRKNTYEFDETAIITSGDGVGVGKIFHYVEGKYALHQRAYRIHINTPDVFPKYFFYFMKTTFLSYIEKNSFHSSVTSIRRPMLNNYLVPIPSLEEQQRIVDILDRFDKLCNDISEGLPAEIEARKKQYEYYRDKLLIFKEKEA